ncbi:MAG: hypothetical protein IPL73_19845 [Candidatus Obscuribacter sp.]|nr:hypothetical protein [Candidatus Obscuribacter sp.]
MFDVFAWAKLKARAVEIPCKSPERMTIPAASMAILVPVPMAMPTCALPGRSVIDTIAHHGDDFAAFYEGLYV